MSPETLNLLLGAAIALIAAIITSAINHHYQKQRDERNRKWELEDRQIQRKRELLDNRVADAEDYIDNIFKIIQRTLESLKNYSLGSKQESIALIQESMKYVQKYLENQASISVIGDEYLRNETDKLIHLQIEIQALVLPNSISDPNYIDEYLMPLGVQALKIKANLIKRLDELRAQHL